VTKRASARALPRLLKSAISLVWGSDRCAFSLSFGLQLTNGVVTAVQVYFITKVVSALLASQSGKPVSDAIGPIVALAVLLTFSGISFSIVRQQQRLLAELTERRTKAQILDVAGAVDLAAYETSDFYDRLSRVQASAATRPYFLTTGLITFAGGMAGALSLAVAVVLIQPMLLPLIVLAGVPLWFTGRRAGRREFEFAVVQTPIERMRDYLDATLTGRSEAKELRAFGAVGLLRRRYDEVYDTFVLSLRKHVIAKQWLGIVGSVSSGLLLIGTFVVLIWLVENHHVSLSQVAGAVVGIRLLSGQINALFAGAQQIFESSLFLNDLSEFLDSNPSLADNQPVRRPAPRGFSSVHVDNVSFTYPASDRVVLENVSMSFRRGQVIALVGENGSGKTTLAKLLAGLYEPSSGAIRWDGVDVGEFEPASMRDSIAVIFQDFVRYQLTAKDNVTLGRPERDDDAAMSAAVAQAGADDVVAQLPRGYETILSKQFKDGQELSLGQWQRVALARAFYRDAPFVILDEPSASLDPRAEADLFAKVQNLLSERTVLLISHRFSSVRYADHIYVLRSGRIVEDGSHSDLMRVGGIYADLFTLQAAAYIDRLDAEPS
jgi:ATP-binding cassette subfamily B protein